MENIKFCFCKNQTQTIKVKKTGNKAKFNISHPAVVHLFFFTSLANAFSSDRKDLLSELKLMKQLKPHRHVIRLLGCVTEDGMHLETQTFFLVNVLL